VAQEGAGAGRRLIPSLPCGRPVSGRFSRLLRGLGEDKQARMADELRTRLVQIATRTSGPHVLAELRALPDDLVEAEEMYGQFD
jgi:hypothetical protein